MQRMTRLTLGLATAGAMTLSACGTGGDAGSGGSDGGSDFPNQDVTLIVQAAAGGGSDLASRTLAADLEKALGTSVIVENRPGASGSTAMQYVAEQEADGYTIGFSPVEIAMLGHMNFDVDPADYDFLGQIMNSPGVLSVPTDSPHKDFEAFVEAAQDETMSVANSGAGSIWEAAALGLAEETGAQIEPVPFDGGAPAVAAVIGGQVDAAVGGASETSAAAEQGQLRPLVVFGAERHPLMPDVPTATELGHELEFGGWGGIYAPKGLPDDVRETLASAIEEAATGDTFVDTMSKAGAMPLYKSPEEFTEFVDSEYERFGKLLSS